MDTMPSKINQSQKRLVMYDSTDTKHLQWGKSQKTRRIMYARADGRKESGAGILVLVLVLFVYLF